VDELTHTSSSFSRRAPTAKCKAAALWALVVLFAAPAHCEDLIAQWLQQDGTGSQTEEPRQDLNAVTDAQWKTLFRFGREDPDSDLGRQLLMRVNEKHTNLPYIWIAAFLAGFGAVIGRNQSQGLHTPRSEKSDGAGSTDRAGISGNAWIAVTANLGCAPLRARAANRRLL
jgi:hypothetical protein